MLDDPVARIEITPYEPIEYIQNQKEINLGYGKVFLPAFVEFDLRVDDYSPTVVVNFDGGQIAFLEPFDGSDVKDFFDEKEAELLGNPRNEYDIFKALLNMQPLGYYDLFSTGWNRFMVHQMMVLMKVISHKNTSFASSYHRGDYEFLFFDIEKDIYNIVVFNRSIGYGQSILVSFDSDHLGLHSLLDSLLLTYILYELDVFNKDSLMTVTQSLGYKSLYEESVQ